MATTHRFSTTLLGGLLLIGVTACGGGGGRDEFVTQMQEQGSTAEEANCVADELEGKVDLEELAQADAETLPSDEDFEAMFAAFAACSASG